MDLDTLAGILPHRLLWTAALIAFGLASYWLVNRFLLARAGRRSPEAGLLSAGAPVLLYFTTPTCMPCKTVQRPAIEKLLGEIGDRLQVIEIDATSDPETANRWGVMSVPTTFLIDALGKPRFVNHGIATVEKLRAQYRKIDA